MIGTPLGSGVRGRIIAAIQHATEQNRVVVLVKVTQSSGTEYVTGLMWIDASGALIGDEWDAGRYHRNIAAAVVHLAERSEQVAHNALS